MLCLCKQGGYGASLKESLASAEVVVEKQRIWCFRDLCKAGRAQNQSIGRHRKTETRSKHTLFQQCIWPSWLLTYNKLKN